MILAWPLSIDGCQNLVPDRCSGPQGWVVDVRRREYLAHRVAAILVWFANTLFNIICIMRIKRNLSERGVSLFTGFPARRILVPRNDTIRMPDSPVRADNQWLHTPCFVS